jgi:L-ascorbate metabolism protein UlaG (beta-lactamase superfamily)
MRMSVRGLFALLVAVPLAAAAQAGAKPAAPAGGAKGKTEVTWYGHAAFVVKTPGGTLIAIDPWLSNPKAPEQGLADKLEKVDYVLVSHGHFDHVGDAVAIGKRTGAKLVSNFEIGQSLVALGYPKDQAGFETLGNIGGAIEAGDATVIMVPAIHSSGVAGDNGATHPGGNPMGFVIKVKGGPTLYHTGDTDLTQDMKLIPERYGPVDVMLSCIGGHFTMDPAGAAMAAGFVKAKTVVPMHFGTFPVLTGTPQELEKALKGRAKVLVMVPGKAATF